MKLNAKLLPTGAQYAELRKHSIQNTRLSMIDGSLVTNTSDHSQGLNCRVFQKGCWGVAASATLSADQAKYLGRQAKDNAISLSQFGSDKSLAGAGFQIERCAPRTQNWTRAKRIDFLDELHAICERKYPKLVSTNFRFTEELHEKELVNSLGSASYTDMARSVLWVEHTVLNKAGAPIQMLIFLGGRGMSGDLGLTLSDLEERMDQLYQWVLDKAEGIPAKAGLVDCIVSPNLAGILAHEAMGHPCEADIVNSGAITAGLVGKQVASDLITMQDLAHTYQGELLPVPVFVDDEGVEAKDVTLIKDGILQGFMHNRETAAAMNVEPTGNARGFMFEDEPLIRMRNTIIEPGQSKLEDMIADMEDGYLLLQTSNGQADTTTEFMFGVPLGYEVKNGKVGRAIKDTTVSGRAIDMLQTVTAVSDDFNLKCAGYCGKKQKMVVSMGGPALRCKINIGGA